MTDLGGAGTESVAPGGDTAATLTSTVLEEEARRLEAAEREREETVLPDDLLPGVGDDAIGVREGIKVGGRPMLAVLFALAMIDEFDRQALAILAPDIQDTLGVSDAVLGAIGGAFGVLFVLGAIPMASLADRSRRTYVAGGATGLWALIVFSTGFVQNAFSLFVARMGTGLGQSNVLPVHNSLLADTYPIGARGRIFAIHAMASPVGQIIAPTTVGAIAAIAGGDEGWRWAFILIAIPAAILAVLVTRVKEPPRGRWEQEAVLGHQLEEEEKPLPVSIGAAFTRLRKIRTFYFLITGVGALGFALFSYPIFFNLFIEEEFDLSAFERGLVGTAIVSLALISVPIVGVVNERLLRTRPPSSLLLAGALISAFGVLIIAGLYVPNLAGLIILVAIGTSLSRAAFAVIGPVVASVVPYRLRSMGFAMVGIYIFLMGGFVGAVLTGLLSDSFGERTAMAIVVIPSTMIGGAIVAYGSRHIRRDISLVVEELEEERAEQDRVNQPGAETPKLQIANLDFSYGTVQVLFDIDLEITPGEVVALLGTNGAGKSTLLRAISGLGIPDRGVVRYDGRTISFVDPEVRVKLGIVQVPGGKAVFPPLTVEENLIVGAWTHGRNQELIDERIADVYELFPALELARKTSAGDLSGGQQQMLALGKAMLLDPDVLLIDELSLGLAPIVVQELLGVVEALKARGMTMIIVEQSVNVALEFADRAVFMEKGEIKFTGSAQELLERDDLARAVFLGAEGG